jgi:16S rRNA (cytidine1402-2'-O)-methyltransferase
VLTLVGTPIGNLDDMAPRAVAALRDAQLIAAEDTRAAERLLSHFGLPRPRIVSLFEGNEAEREGQLLAALAAGQKVTVISEAGMPGVSDPGQRLVAAARAQGVKVEVVPGPSAVLVALVGSGLPSDRFRFVGFPPRDPGPRRELFGRLAGDQDTLILFEAPPRVGATLADLAATFGEQRPACLARELTKLHEEFVPGTLAELAARFADTPPRGECTLVIGGASAEESRARADASMDVESAIRAQLAAGASAKEIAARLALATGKPRRQLYQLALALAGKKPSDD